MKIQYDFQNKVWIELEKNSPEGFYFSRKLNEKIGNIEKIQKKGWDSPIIIDGNRRSGKSVLGMTIGYRLDPENFGVDNICYGTEEAINKIKTLPPRSVLMIDEGSLLFQSKETLKKEQIRLMKILDICGLQELVLIIILPSFFDLNKGIAVTHSRFLLHVYTDKQLNRGRFSYFGTREKAQLYELGKKNYGSYKKPEANFIDRFVNFNPLGDEYLNLKRR